MKIKDNFFVVVIGILIVAGGYINPMNQQHVVPNSHVSDLVLLANYEQMYINKEMGDTREHSIEIAQFVVGYVESTSYLDFYTVLMDPEGTLDSEGVEEARDAYMDMTEDAEDILYSMIKNLNADPLDASGLELLGICKNSIKEGGLQMVHVVDDLMMLSGEDPYFGLAEK